MSNRWIAAGSAGVLTIYGVGFAHTQEAADRLDAMAERPRVVIPDGPIAGASDAERARQAADTVPAIQVVARVGPGQPEPSAPTIPEASTDPEPAAEPVPVETAPATKPAPPPGPVETPAEKAGAATPAETAAAGAALPAEPAAGDTGKKAALPQAQAPTSVEPPANPPADPPADPPASPPVTTADTPVVPPATTGDASAPPTSQPPTPEPTPEPAPTAQWKDGTYFGWGSSRHGNIQAAVVIEDGRIASATIAQCRTRYSCSWIAKLPPQVSERQSPETDFVSGATQSTNAFYYAVIEALSKAK